MTKLRDNQLSTNQNNQANDRNDAFIETYKKLEAFANKKFNKTGRYMPMSQLTDMMLSRLVVARDFATDLELFNNLRNMMQHKASDRYFIIQPEVVRLIEHVYDVLTKPITVGSIFTSEVIFISESADFQTVIQLVKAHHHTQFPVVKSCGGVMRKLVTANAITHALTGTTKPSVSQILSYSEAVVRLIKPSESIFIAEKMMLDEMKNGRKSVVLLLSQTTDFKKLKPIDVVGLINIADLPQILEKK